MKTLEILDRLIAFPTVSADSNLAVIDYIQDYLATRGFDVHRIPDETGLKAGLFARIGPGWRHAIGPHGCSACGGPKLDNRALQNDRG